MRAALIGLAALAAVGLSEETIGPATAALDPAFDDRPNAGCPPVRTVEEAIVHAIQTTRGGTVLAVKPDIGAVYLAGIGLKPPTDGYGAILIYRREDITDVGVVTVDMERPARAAPSRRPSTSGP